MEIESFEQEGFMTWSGTGGASHGHSCGGAYTQGESCGAYSWDSGDFAGASCGNYDGSHCYAYTDENHSSSNPCTNYSISCNLF